METLIAPDWLKDFDPLFDLFDEEIGNDSSQSASCSLSPFSTNYIDDFDLYSSSVSNHLIHHHHHQHAGAGVWKQQADEFNLLLDLEWLPRLDSLQQQHNNQHHQPNEQHQTKPYSKRTAINVASSNINSGTTTTFLPSSSSSNSSPCSSSCSSASVASSYLPAVCVESTNKSPASQVQKRKKKCPKTKGTSLLANPSPKPVHIRSQDSSTLSTNNSSSTVSQLNSHPHSTSSGHTLPQQQQQHQQQQHLPQKISSRHNHLSNLQQRVVQQPALGLENSASYSRVPAGQELIEIKRRLRIEHSYASSRHALLILKCASSTN